MNLVSLFSEIVIIFHNVNKFLGSEQGVLLKEACEFFLFLLISYMATSQYLKLKNRQVKYLSIAFLTLALTKLIGTGFYTATIFGEISTRWIHVYIPPFETAFESIALLLLCIALTYQLLRIKIKHLRAKVYLCLFTLALLQFLFLVYWITTLRAHIDTFFIRTPFFLFLESFKLFILSAFIFFVSKNYEKSLKAEPYSRVILQALIVYAIPSLLHIFNYLVYFGLNERLIVLANPFPFIAVFLFMRFIYLKLADKANLMDKLDLTEKKYKRMKEITKIKDEFVSIASHELKTPLTTINLYTSLLTDGTFGSLNDQQKEALITLKGETRRLTNLVNDLLDMSRIQHKKMAVRKEHTNFGALAQEVLFGFIAQNPHIAFINKVPEHIHAHIDGDKIRQVLINIISNAVKFSKKKNAVIEVSAKRTQKSLVFAIRDNGRGIPKTKLAFLFEKFFQVDPALGREEGISGLGLGLAIVKGIVDSHSGEIHVESQLNKGTNFIVKIPQDSVTQLSSENVKNPTA